MIAMYSLKQEYSSIEIFLRNYKLGQSIAYTRYVKEKSKVFVW